MSVEIKINEYLTTMYIPNDKIMKYNDLMRSECNDLVELGIDEFTDFNDDEETIPIEITANRNKIVCKSYSGTYTWTVMI